jgi:hypothetical protein
MREAKIDRKTRKWVVGLYWTPSAEWIIRTSLFSNAGAADARQAMTKLWKHPKTGVLYLRQRTPSDLVAYLNGQPVTLPIGDIQRTVRIWDSVEFSLRTKNPGIANARAHRANRALNEFWERTRAEMREAD